VARQRKTTACAAAKGGQRWLARSLAKEFAPKGVHLSYIIIDGMEVRRTSRQPKPEPIDQFKPTVHPELPTGLATPVRIFQTLDASSYYLPACERCVHSPFYFFSLFR
jgi:NAD(P)-dependent dehydrogenase (short-subunit alcohol dehydrogenase family)